MGEKAAEMMEFQGEEIITEDSVRKAMEIEKEGNETEMDKVVVVNEKEKEKAEEGGGEKLTEEEKLAMEVEAPMTPLQKYCHRWLEDIVPIVDKSELEKLDAQSLAAKVGQQKLIETHLTEGDELGSSQPM